MSPLTLNKIKLPFNRTASYSILLRLLHWLMLPMLAVQVISGFYSASLPFGFERFIWLSRHKSFGMLLLALALFRVFARLLQKQPGYGDSLSPVQIRLATSVHYGLYLCLLLIPISGWLMASAAKLPPGFFGLFQFPALIAENKSISLLFNQAHTFLVWFFCFLFSLHLFAVIYHIKIIKDAVFDRIAIRFKPDQ